MANDIRTTLAKMEGQISLALPKHVSKDRFLRCVFTQFSSNRRLQECSPTSFIASVMKAAERGLMPDGRMGALVPYNTKNGMVAQFIPMYQGIISLMRQSGEIKDVYPASIRENDYYDWQLGLHPDLVHRPPLADRGEILAVYAIATFKDGTRSFGPGPMTLQEVLSVRERSRAKDSGPWVTDFEPMAWKTVLRRNGKYWPSNDELRELLEESDFVEFQQERPEQAQERPQRVSALKQIEQLGESATPQIAEVAIRGMAPWEEYQEEMVPVAPVKETTDKAVAAAQRVDWEAVDARDAERQKLKDIPAHKPAPASASKPAPRPTMKLEQASSETFDLMKTACEKAITAESRVRLNGRIAHLGFSEDQKEELTKILDSHVKK